MQCDLCQNKATVFFTQMQSEGGIKKTAYCESCAEEQGVTDPFGLPGETAIEDSKMQDTKSQKALSNECPECQFTLDDLRKVGRLGCSHCFQYFREEIGQRLLSLHKGDQHSGRFPQILLDIQDRATRLAELHQQLQEAVAQEDYEKAASVRDEVRQIEEEKEGGQA